MIYIILLAIDEGSVFINNYVSISELQKTAHLKDAILPDQDCDDSRLECHAHGNKDTY